MTKEIFKKLFDKYFDLIRNYIYYRSGDQELATDIAQDVFLRIWEKKLIPDADKEKGLLFKIAKDLLISRIRRQNQELKFISRQDADHEINNPENQMKFSQLKQQYENAINAMNENQRIVFLMSRVDGLKYHEIADSLKISIKAVEKRMSKALLFMKSKILDNE